MADQPAAARAIACRRTNRPLELGGALGLRAPAGSMMNSGSVFVPLREGTYFVVSTHDVPADARGPEIRECSLNAWQPWDQDVSQCFEPGIPLDYGE